MEILNVHEFSRVYRGKISYGELSNINLNIIKEGLVGIMRLFCSGNRHC